MDIEHGSVEEIGDDTFSNCLSLTAILFDKDASLTSIGRGAFAQSAIEVCDIPAKVTTIGEFAMGQTIIKLLDFVEGDCDELTITEDNFDELQICVRSLASRALTKNCARFVARLGVILLISNGRYASPSLAGQEFDQNSAGLLSAN